MAILSGLKEGLRRIGALLLAALLALAPESALAEAAAKDVALKGVRVKPGEVVLSLSGPAAYEDFMLSHPARLVLQIPHASNRLPKNEFAGHGKLLKDVRVSQFATAPMPVARVVLDLTRQIACQVFARGNDIIVALSADAAVNTALGTSWRAHKTLPAVPDPPARALMPPPLPITRGLTGAKAPPPDIMNHLPTDLVTLDFDHTDIQDILQMFQTKAKINIIYGPDVGGQITLHLDNVPFNEAFRTVLNMMDLTTTQVGDKILRVLTPDTLASVQKQAATATEVIPLNYAKASDLVTTINKIASVKNISGTALADAKTNSIIITQSPDSLADTERLIAQLDVRPKQVLIEAKLIEVQLTDEMSYGVQWNETGQGVSKLFGQTGTNTSGVAYATANTGTGSGNSVLYPTPSASTLGTITNGTGVNLPPGIPAMGALTLGRITNNYLLNATLSAAAALDKVKILSDPKVATLNNQPATINVTSQIPYVTATVVPGNVGSGAVVPETVNYVTEGIQLTVTPIINADNRITLNISPNISQPSTIAPGAAAASAGAPAIDTRSAQTTVMIHDGETIVVGGLIHDSVTHNISKIPLLGDIPLLGWLFKSVYDQHIRTELLIFVTPKIIED